MDDVLLGIVLRRLAGSPLAQQPAGLLLAALDSEENLSAQLAGQAAERPSAVPAGPVGLSQRQLAEGAGMAQPGVARFEAGGTTPTIPVLERLARALGLRLTIALHLDERRSS